jgi:TM2 domain-containing membrane protein YozV
VEKVSFSKEIDQTRRAAIASGLSLIPGLGRTYAGNPIDGIYSFIFVSGFTIQAYQHHSAGNTLQAYLTGGLACLFWLADIYGSYRTVHQSALAP